MHVYSIVSDSLQPCDLWTVPAGLWSMQLFRQEYWSGLLFPPPGDLLIQGSVSLASPALAGRFFTTIATREPSLFLHTAHHADAYREKRGSTDAGLGAGVRQQGVVRPEANQS